MESAIKLTLISLVICACSVGTKAKYTQGCEDRYTSLDCGSDLIDVQLASYGRTDRITCSDGRSCHELSNTSCSAPSSLSEVKKRCDGRMTCMVKASSLIFSDPCAGISKYLEVLYRCVSPEERTSQTCEGGEGKLECGSNVIHIHDASYGRTDETTCSSGRPAHQLSNTNCYAPTTLPITRERCEGRSTCTVHSSNHIFTDPCFGTYKYLHISYSCVPPKSSQTCEGHHSSLECGSNVIHIHDASYGRTDETTCSSGRPAHQLSNTNCYAPTTLPITRERCEGRSTCTVHSSNHIFTDPCFGTYKYLHISYSCVPPKSSQTCEGHLSSLECGSNVIHIHDASYGRTDETTCSSGRPAHQLSNTNCYAPTTLPITRERCEGRSTCTVHSSNHIFTDPCFGTYKYLHISYSCVPPKSSQTCEGHLSSLECGSNVIHIHDASYGRTDETTCSSGRPAHQLSNTNCYAPTTLPITRERCEGRSTCTVHSSNHIFTDPCFGTYKYLHISYSCVPPKSSQTCEGHHSSLECGSKVIQIQAANYGRTDGTTCADGTNPSQVNNTSCFSTNTLSDMRQMCQGKSSCEVRATNAELSNPCPGTHKYLNISYSCTSNSSQICEGDAMRINCGSNHFIKIHEANYGRTDATICSQEHRAHRISNTTCYSPNALCCQKQVCSYINMGAYSMFHCEGEVRCTITVSNSIFSNPCPGTHKYLDVTYSCVPPISSQTCEGNSTILDCGPNVISIHTANYGRTNRDICSAGQPDEAVSNTNCRTSRTRPKLQDMCDGKPTCKVTASSSTFFTPRNCEDTYKYLDLSYSCKAPSSP
ncbi:uncharacterized protein LOC121697680 [Alosa sapidissima]|uniref:uncharacterized protein LOC121697680 n=1 Tax=Alosa sapidissima TaxID=34773 RepID=UPI001C082BAB|nr:uncharacterized protein LOC121697680 [Alosa sapidissima]